MLVSTIQETQNRVSCSSPLKPFLIASLPIPPGINGSYKAARRKKVDGTLSTAFFATAELEQFKQEAAYRLADVKMTVCDWSLTNAIREASRRGPGKRVRHTPLSMQLCFYFKSLWKRDVDGGVKAVQDAVFSYLGLNDNLVVDQHIHKRLDPGNPRVEVQLSCVIGGVAW